MIRKLLLVRKNAMRSDLVKSVGLGPFIKGEPLNVSPMAWNEEAGLSHYAFPLEGMKLKDMEKLDKWINESEGTLVHDYDNKDESTEDALKRLGLRINAAA